MCELIYSSEEVHYQDAKRRIEEKKILKRFIQLNLKNTPFTNQMQTADFPGPQINVTCKVGKRVE